MIEFSIMFGPASGVILANAFLTKEKTVRRALFAAARQLVVPFGLVVANLNIGPHREATPIAAPCRTRFRKSLIIQYEPLFPLV